MDFEETKDEVKIEMKSTMPANDELLFVINQALKDDNWFQEKTYTLDQLKFEKTELPTSLIRLINFANELKKWVQDEETEVYHWGQKGLYCVFMSILIKVMYEELDKEDASNLEYYQGAYKMSNGQYTLHGWLNYGGIVIDITAAGQHDTLIGCKESQETVERYVNKFAVENRMTMEEWLERYLYIYKNA